MIRYLAIATFGALLASSAVSAATHEITMLNKGTEGVMVFEPAFVAAAPGDTIIFRATDKGHNAETIKGMTPVGAEMFKGKMGEDVTVTLTTEGLYAVKCMPHFGMGMVGLVQVGKPVNLDAIKAAPMKGKAKTRFELLLAQVAP